MRQQLVNNQIKINHMTRIKSTLADSDWRQVASGIGICLPDDVWLDSMNVDADGLLAISGGSYSEDGVYELVRWLRQSPLVDHVALSGTRPTRLRTGPATQFDIQCNVSNLEMSNLNDKEGANNEES